MKSLKIFSFFLALFLIGINTGFAQSKANLTDEQEEQIAQSLEEYFSAMDLSEEQKSEFEAITRKYAEQMQAVNEKEGSKMQKFQQVRAIRKNKDAEMKKLLSKDQYQIYLEKQEEIQKKMKDNRS